MPEMMASQWGSVKWQGEIFVIKLSSLQMALERTPPKLIG